MCSRSPRERSLLRARADRARARRRAAATRGERASSRSSARSCRATTPGATGAQRDLDAEPDVGDARRELVARGLDVDHRERAGRQRARRGRGRAARGPTDAISLGQRQRARRSQLGRSARVPARALAGDRRRERRELAADREAETRGRLVVRRRRAARRRSGRRTAPAARARAPTRGPRAARGTRAPRRRMRGRGRSSRARLRGAARRVPPASPRRRSRASPRCLPCGRRAAGPRAACPPWRGSSRTRGTRRSATESGSPRAGHPVEAEVEVLADDLEDLPADDRFRQPRVARDLVPERAEHGLGEPVAIDAPDNCRERRAVRRPCADCDASQQLWRGSSGSFGDCAASLGTTSRRVHQRVYA